MISEFSNVPEIDVIEMDADFSRSPEQRLWLAVLQTFVKDAMKLKADLEGFKGKGLSPSHGFMRSRTDLVYEVLSTKTQVICIELDIPFDRFKQIILTLVGK